MCFNEMYDFNFYQQCLSVVEFKVERLKELATEKSQSIAISAQESRKHKIAMVLIRRRRLQKLMCRGMTYLFLLRRKHVVSRNPIRRASLRPSIIIIESRVISRETARRQKRFTIVP